MYDIKILLISFMHNLLKSFTSVFSDGALMHLNGPGNAIVLRKREKNTTNFFYSDIFFLACWEMKDLQWKAVTEVDSILKKKKKI